MVVLSAQAGAEIIGSEHYSYDESGNLVSKTIDGNGTTMEYDNQNRLSKVQGADGCQVIVYDASGQPVRQDGGPEQGARSMSYGYGGKVTQVDSTEGSASFLYNAEGRLVGEQQGGKVESYAWDDNVLAFKGEEAFVNEAHVVGGVPLLINNKEVVVSDYLGNTLANGEQRLESTVYGEGLESARYSGKPFVKALGQFAYQHRFYSPEIGRWSTPDPSGYPDGGNNFEHVGADPLSRYDALGLSDNAVVDPLNDEMFASTGWDRYNQFWHATDDTEWFPYPGFFAEGIETEVRVKYEYWRNTTGDAFTIPQNSFIVVSSIVGTTDTLQGGLTAFSTVSFSASSSVHVNASLSKNIDAYAKGNPAMAYDYLSTAQIRGERVYQHVQHRYKNSQGNWGSWGSYVHQPIGGQITSKWRGWTNDILGIAEKKEQ